jgi:hypothetical protein
MPTIRVQDWTKRRMEEIRERESHSSYDSVIKSLLKDRRIASFADAGPDSRSDSTPDSEPSTVETAVEDLTVFAELRRADNGVVFLWCPGCGTEIAHLSVENPVTIPVFEVECRNCLAHLDQHALVVIEIGYPLERRLVENALEDDLRTCVVDYWDRTLRGRNGAVDPQGGSDADADEKLVWQLDQYVREFNWEWPQDVPVVGIRAGHTYRNDATGDHLEVTETVAQNRNAPDSYRVRRYEPGAPAATVEPERLPPETITSMIINRELIRIDGSPGAAEN